MTNTVDNGRIDIPDILKLLPHRYPFLLIDRVIEFEAYAYLKAAKNVSVNEHFFMGHFPNQPIMPGVLILEALAQASGVLCSKSMVAAEGKRFMYYFAGIDNARFRRMVIPGDVLELQVDVLKHKKEIWKMRGQASVDGELVCTADLMSAAKEEPCD